MSVLSVGDFFRKMYLSASDEQTMINRLFDYFLIMCLVIVIIVSFMVIYGAYRYRARRNEEGEPRQITGNTRLELIWTITPLLTLVLFFFLTLDMMKSIDRPPEDHNNPDINIIAHQFWWEIRYPGSNVITANELHIPAGKHILLRLTSTDVIHSWWVTELGRKMDAIPGRFNFLWIQAKHPGVFLGTCSEYCGAQHAWMRIYVKAETQTDFEKWIAEQGRDFQSPNDSLVNAGFKLFQQKTCSNCHAIKGTNLSYTNGPDLTHLMSRKTLVAGVLDNNPGNLERWIKEPQQIKPGSKMPNLMLNEAELKLMLKFMEELK